jgi:hypothetical protein
MTFPTPETAGQFILAGFNYLLLFTSLLLTSYGLDIDWKYLALAVGSSLAGSVLLQYIQREKVRAERLFKGLISMVGGLIFGSAIITHWEVERSGYIAAIYCSTSTIILIVARAAVGFFEQNAPNIISDIFNTFLDRFRSDRSKRRRSRNKASRHDLPRVVPDDTDGNDDREN